jgi:urocanate hydratase
MYGQMTAGSWIYIGTQGILQGTYETFAAVARSLGRDSLAGTLTLTAGAGGMGGAQPLAVTLNDGVVLIVDVDESRLRRRVEHGYLDEYTTDLDAAVARVAARKPPARRSASASSATPPRSSPNSCAARLGAIAIDIVTDQTSAHDPLAYLPIGIQSRNGRMPRHPTRPLSPTARAPPWRRTSRRWSGSRMPGPPCSTTATRSGARPSSAASTGRSRSRVRAGLHPAAVRRGSGPFRWVALSGDPEDIAKTDRAVDGALPRRRRPASLAREGGRDRALRGLPARICWLGYKERHLAGLRFNEMVASGELAGRS